MEDIASVDVTEVEVTPEMVDAGSAVLCRMNLSLADEEFWAVELYRAMTACAPSSVAASSKSVS